MIVPSDFQKETDLCAAFIAALPKGWTAYPETGGFDILLVRVEDGFQIGVEAKLKLNAKVVCQAAEGTSHWSATRPGPDCRAVLVPEGKNFDLQAVCKLIGITPIQMFGTGERRSPRDFSPDLPRIRGYGGMLVEEHDWFECAPATRLHLPDYVPDVIAGDSAPVTLSHWKIGAIKLVITLAKRGYLTRHDFKHFSISMSRWTQGGWLVKNGKGGWIEGPYMPNFAVQHPINYVQIEADQEKWKAPEVPTQIRMAML